ncbi:MAG: alpha/beta hydrolase, partial [Bacteroidota bacterium]
LLMTKAGEIFPGIPVVLYGHSMGGNLVLNYIISRKLKNIPLIVTSPWLKLAFEPPAFKLFMAKLVRKILPGLLQSTGLKTKDLTKNNSVVDKYENDELVHGKISVNMFFEMYQAGYRVLDNAEKIKCPVLLMHGTEDGICSWQGSSELASKAKGNITFKTWEGLYHELHNEAEQDKVFMFIISWLEKL